MKLNECGIWPRGLSVNIAWWLTAVTLIFFWGKRATIFVIRLIPLHWNIARFWNVFRRNKRISKWHTRSQGISSKRIDLVCPVYHYLVTWNEELALIKLYGTCYFEEPTWQCTRADSLLDILYSSHIITLRSTQYGRHFADDILNAFSWMKMLKFVLKFHWSVSPRVHLTLCQH